MEVEVGGDVAPEEEVRWEDRVQYRCCKGGETDHLLVF
jgi:hypothetical protein